MSLLTIINMPQRIKVAYLDYSHVFAGAERVLHTILSTLDREKFEPVLVFPFPMEHQKGYDDIKCGRIYLADGLKWWMGSKRWNNPIKGTDFMARTIWGVRLAYQLKRRGIGILHVNLLRPDALMWLLPARSAGIRIIGHFRSQELEWIAPPYVQHQCNQILCVSEYSRNRMLTKGVHTPSRVLYDSIETSRFQKQISKTEARKVLGLNVDAEILASVGQLSVHKGHDNAIRALAILATKRPNMILFIAGGGGVSNKYLKDILEENPAIKNRVIFSGGQIADIQNVYIAADLTLSLSRGGEGFGLIPYESALCGTPFIGPNQGAILEFIIDNENGMLVDTYSPEAIAAKIDWALEHRAITQAMVTQTKQLIEDRLTPEVMIMELQAVYSELMN